MKVEVNPRLLWSFRRRPPMDRWLDSIEFDENGCWIYQGTPSGGKDGYGSIWINGKSEKAHVYGYVALVGPIPSGMELDHLCRVRMCVNPLHLEPVTHRINILRGDSPIAHHAVKTHCNRGHPLSGDNLCREKNGGRRCIQCRNEGARRRWREHHVR